MSQEKKIGKNYVQTEADEALPPTERDPALADDGETEQPVRQIRDHVVASSTFIEDIDLLAANNLEFQQIMALQGSALRYPTMDFAQIKRNLLNIIDTHWDIYKRQFSLPDRLVCLKFTSADGDFYLGLNNGYLCFYKNPWLKNRTAFPLVHPEEAENKRQPN